MLNRTSLESVLRILIHARNMRGSLRAAIREAIQNDIRQLRNLK